MNMKSMVIILSAFAYASWLVHTGEYGFGKWSKDSKNGFHMGIAFAAFGVIIEGILSFLDVL